MAISTTDVFGFLALWVSLHLHVDKGKLDLQVHKTRPAIPALVFSLITNGWIWGMYGTLDDEFFPVGTGGVMTVVLDSYCAYLLYTRTQDKASLLKIVGVFGLFLVAATTYVALGAYGYTHQTQAQVQQIVGYTGVVNMLVVLSFQLKTITEAFKHSTNDCIPLLAVSVGVLSATMWIIYCVLASVWVLFVPNVAALVLGVTQWMLYLMLGPSNGEGAEITVAEREVEALEASKAAQYELLRRHSTEASSLTK